MLKCFCCKKKPKSIIERLNKRPKSRFFGCKIPKSEMETQQTILQEALGAISFQEHQPQEKPQ